MGTATLDVVLVVALGLTLLRPLNRDDEVGRARAVTLWLVGVALQCGHFVEEYLTGIQVRFPELLGLTPWPDRIFVVFNVVWIAIWVASAVALRAGHRAALFPAWFFALGMTLNGIAHPLLALQAGGYFPGLATSPLVGIVGVLLLARLRRLTVGGNTS